MKQNRRKLLLAIGAAAIIMTTQATAMETSGIHGTIEFANAEPIPEGQIKIQLENTANQNKAKSLPIETQITSNGKSEKMEFLLPLPAQEKTSSTSRIIVLLERDDGWLLARGSAKLNSDSPTNVILHTVMY